MSFRPSVGSILTQAASVVGFIFLALPLIILVAMSFTDGNYLAFPPQGFSLRWYGEVLTDQGYLGAFATSTYLALFATALALVLGIPVALVISRSTFMGKDLVKGLFLSPLLLPLIVIGAATLQYATALGFARSFFALLIGHVVIVIPYIVRTVLASLVGFRAELEEAARDLGASGIRTFFLITIPVIKPGIIAGALFAFIISWTNLEVSIFHVTAKLITLPVEVFNDIQFSIGPAIAAVSAVTIYVAIAAVLAIDLLVGVNKVDG